MGRKKSVAASFLPALLVGLALVWSLCCVSGCYSGQFADPNDPTSAGLMQPDVINNDLKDASDTINDRVAKGYITVDEGRKILSDYAKHLLGKVKVEETPVAEAWKYGQAFITAKEWHHAIAMLKVALKNPPNEDRWVNDTLRLAHCEAEIGHVDKAINLTKSTFRATPKWKWPILYATYLEIVPAALKHSTGKDLVLAQLVEEAIHQHELAWGDPSKKKYQAWLQYRDFQIRNAWGYIATIYKKAGQTKLAQQALAEAEKQPPSFRV